MADSELEEKLSSLEIRLAELEGVVGARERTLPAHLDRIEDLLERFAQKVAQIEWFIFGSWLTLMLALIGGFYLK